mgnify:CR=1 FL=1
MRDVLMFKKKPTNSSIPIIYYIKLVDSVKERWSWQFLGSGYFAPGIWASPEEAVRVALDTGFELETNPLEYVDHLRWDMKDSEITKLIEFAKSVEIGKG